MGKTVRTSKPSSPSKIKLASIVIFLALSLGLLLGVMNTPQDIRQRAQNTTGRTPPQCAASGGQPGTGICVVAPNTCLPGEEQDEGQLDCATGQTCCSLAAVPAECDAQSNLQTFCSTAANCTTLYNGQNLGQFDCGEGTICCKNPQFPTPTPTPTEALEPTATEEPTPTFGSISGPGEEEIPTEIPQEETQPTATPAPAPATQDGGLLQIIILLLGLILGLLGR